MVQLSVFPSLPLSSDPHGKLVTQGNHSATQSTFAAPCIPARRSNSTINGFDSWYRDAGNYTAITQLSYVVDDPRLPIWFFDYSLCDKGGVGAINTNESSTETFAGFVVNTVGLVLSPLKADYVSSETRFGSMAPSLRAL